MLPAHLVVMNAQDEDGQQWNEDDVQQVETQQASGTDVWRAPQQQVYLIAKDGSRLGHAGADGHRPVSKLIPREQITTETQEQRDQKQDHTSKPGEGAFFLIRSGQIGTQHM